MPKFFWLMITCLALAFYTTGPIGFFFTIIAAHYGIRLLEAI